MKARQYLVAALALGLLAALLVGCNLAGASIESRIESFVSDLNTSRPDAISNFHPVETADYGAISGNPDYWDIDFPEGGGSYTVEFIDSGDPLSVRVTIDRSGDVAWPKEFEFIMLQDGMTWYIEELWYWGIPDFIVQ